MRFWTAWELIRFLTSLLRGSSRSKRLSWVVVVATIHVVRAAARTGICSAIPNVVDKYHSWLQRKASQRYLQHMRSNSIDFDMLLPHSPRRNPLEPSPTLPAISETAHEIEEDKKAQ